jgi:hypothetical protein
MASSSHLKPGEQGTITARMSTTGKKGPATETLEVVSNDPKRPKVTLTLRASVLENLPLQQEQNVCK